jgi:hypothetical protein
MKCSPASSFASAASCMKPALVAAEIALSKPSLRAFDFFLPGKVDVKSASMIKYLRWERKVSDIVSDPT